MFGLLADLVVVLHLVFILFAALGGLLGLRWWWMPWVHLPAAAWGAFIEVSGGICPLTPLENDLRAAAGQPGYAGDFVERYLTPAIYPENLTHGMQIALGAALLLANAAIYAVVWSVRVKRTATTKRVAANGAAPPGAEP